MKLTIKEVMKTHQNTMKVALVITSLALAAIGADQKDYGRKGEYQKDYPGKHKLSTASDIIGKEVRNDQNEDLGKIQDLILSLDSGRVPYAIIAHGGALGIGRTKTAVPVSALQCSGDGKTLTMSATKEQLRAASKTPSDAWVDARDADWAKTVDGFYGEPVTWKKGQAQYERQSLEGVSERKEFIRDPSQQKGAELLTKPVDTGTDQITVTLRGLVDSEMEKDKLESKVKAIQGVHRVDNQLKIKNQ